MEGNANSSSNVHYKPPFTFGLGGVPLGNEFAVVTDKECERDSRSRVERRHLGMRYDVSPWYGIGSRREKMTGELFFTLNKEVNTWSSRPKWASC